MFQGELEDVRPFTDMDVTALVDEYCRTWRHPNLTPFTVHSRQGWKKWWGSEQSSRPGCYIIYAGSGEPLYLGKASLKASIGSRLAVHERSGHERWAEAEWVQIIEVTEPFEAPSLEEFLLARVATRHNRLGAHRT